MLPYYGYTVEECECDSKGKHYFPFIVNKANLLSILFFPEIEMTQETSSRSKSMYIHSFLTSIFIDYYQLY